MVRAPCCEKMGLKKGPWTPDEDLVLINFINTHGHTNWRALPKQAGLLRCGKSCRLRWTNYLKPDIKRGNFTREEEDTIIELHQMLGNRWSAIAAKLPGRTDNEIKNVWHTHLKKRLPLPQEQQSHDRKRSPKQKMQPNQQDAKQEQNPVNFPSTRHVIKAETTEDRPLSPPLCSSDDMSTLAANSTSDNNEHNSNTSDSCSIITTTATDHDMSLNNNTVDEDDNLALDEDFWSEVLSADNSCEKSDFPVAIGAHQQQLQFPLISPLVTEEGVHLFSSSSSMCDSMDFWDDMFTQELRI